MLPDFGGVSPMMLLNVVVFPAPFLPKETDRFSFFDFKGDTEEDMAGSVIGMDFFYFKHYAVPPK